MFFGNTFIKQSVGDRWSESICVRGSEFGGRMSKARESHGFIVSSKFKVQSLVKS